MPDGEHGLPAGEAAPAVGVQIADAPQGTVFNLQSGEPGPEADLPAEGDNLLSDVLHHSDQHVGADVGLRVVQHGFRGPVSVKLPQHP